MSGFGSFTLVDAGGHDAKLFQLEHLEQSPEIMQVLKRSTSISSRSLGITWLFALIASPFRS